MEVQEEMMGGGGRNKRGAERNGLRD